DATNTSLKFATCPATSSCTAPADWVKTTIDPNETGGRSAIARNQDGGKEVAYPAVSRSGMELRYAACNGGCGQAANWFKVILGQTGPHSARIVPSFAISGGARHITYYDQANGELRYATCASDCTN